MKRLLTFLLLGIHLITFMEFHQFLRIPFMLQHYSVHRAKDPSMTLTGFLKQHYLTAFDMDDDYDQDRELPFRQTDCCVMTATTSCECPSTSIVIAYNIEELHNEYILYDEEDHSLIAVADIFQPPRAA
jgi:hypothetical protein